MASSADAQWLDWYQQFDHEQGANKRKEWYSDSTQAYRWARPRYPDALVEKVIGQAHLEAQSKLFEIGCGPGIATEAFAREGISIVAVEPSEAACKLARRATDQYANVKVINTTFEQYVLESPFAQQFDVVLAATSFHWVSAEVACAQSAAALKPTGSLILLWATPPQPSEEISDCLQPIYERYGLSELSEGQRRSHTYYQTNFEHFANTINNSGFFQPSNVSIEEHHTTYSIERYLALLTTLSPYIALEEETRESLLVELGEKLSEKLETGALKTTHWFGSQVAPVKTST